MLADLTATHTFLVDHLCQSVDDPKVAAVGFCLGGRLAFVANAAFPLAAAACFYGGGIANTQLERAADQHGPLALFWGGKDAHITVEHRRAVADALSGAGKTFVEVCFGHAEHGYFCDLRKSYDAHAAKESWALLTAFLEHHLVDEA